MSKRLLQKALILALVFFVLSYSALLAEGKKPEAEKEELRILSARDTLRINQVSGPRISPDGLWVLYTKRIRDMEDKDLKSTTHIWLVGANGNNRKKMTYGKETCTSPAWFPDGKRIAFLTSRGKTEKPSGQKPGPGEGPKNQVFFMYVDGGEAWQATEHKESIQSFEISPDANKILFTAKDSLTEEEERKRKEKDDAEVVDEKFPWRHLWVYDIEKGEASRITEGKFTVGDAHWSPDSSQIVYVTRPNTKVNDTWNSDIWVVDLEAKSPKKLYENPGSDVSPRWSPDGRTIAFASDPHKGTNTWYKKLYLIPTKGGEPKILLKDFDRDFQSPIWAPDGKQIYWGTGDQSVINLFSVEIGSGKVNKIIPPPGANYQWELSKDGKRWVWLHSSADWPGEVYSANLNFKSPVRLSDANSWLQEERKKLGKVEVVKWKNSDGQQIEGVLTKPVDYEPVKKYPLILNPHGGPSGAVTESFNATNQFLSGNGFMILQPNFRGSSNYGQKFLNANRKNWGIVDYDDCMTGVDYCIEQGWADPDRLICYGWSYGGYMSYWIVTQTDRFKAVSPGAGLPNLYSMYSTTDIPHYLGWFFGTPWDNEELFEKHSAIRYVKQVKSPVLIMHGANDARVPPTQAVEFYQALRDLDKDVTFVRYPREGHGIREPRHHLDRLRRYLFFFTKHVGLTPLSEKETKN